MLKPFHFVVSGYLSNLNGGLYVVEKTLQNNAHRKQVWREQTVAYHLRHALKHIVLYFLGGRGEPHLGHAATRTLMAASIAFDMPLRGGFPIDDYTERGLF